MLEKISSPERGKDGKVQHAKRYRELKDDYRNEIKKKKKMNKSLYTTQLK